MSFSRTPMTSSDTSGDELALICAVAGNRYALPLADVVEVTRSVALTTPSGDVGAVVGYADLRGDLVPVVSARRSLALSPRPISVTDRFVVIRSASRLVAVQVDAVEAVEAISAPSASSVEATPGVGITRAGGGHGSTVIRVDVDRLVPRVEAAELPGDRS